MEKTEESTALKADDMDKKGTVVLLKTVLTPDKKSEAAKTEKPPDSKPDAKAEPAKTEKSTAKPKAVKKAVKEEKPDSESGKKTKAATAEKPDSESKKEAKTATAEKPDSKSRKKTELDKVEKSTAKPDAKTKSAKAAKPVAKPKSTANSAKEEKVVPKPDVEAAPTSAEKDDTKPDATLEQNPTVPNPPAVTEQSNTSEVIDSPLKRMKQEFNERTNVIRQEITNIQNSFLVIGFQLHWIKTNKMYRILDYKNIYDYAEKEYSIKKSTCINLVSIIEHFAERDANGEVIESIKDCYRNFSSSQLVAMLSMDEETRQQATPDMSVRAIQRLRKGEPETQPVDVTATTVTDVKKEEKPPAQEPASAASTNPVSEKATSAASTESSNPVSANPVSAPPISEAKAATAMPPVQKTEIPENTGTENESPKESAVVDDTAKDSGKQEEAALEKDNTLMEIDSYNDYQNMTDKLDIMMKHVFSGKEDVRVKILCVYG